MDGLRSRGWDKSRNVCELLMHVQADDHAKRFARISYDVLSPY